MHFLTTLATAISLLALSVTAQNSTATPSNSSVASNYGLNISSVDSSTRAYWCTQQEAQCPLICADTTPNNSSDTNNNECDPDSLTYQCVCSNGLSPNATEYTQTIPYFECTTAATQCVNNCVQGDTNCQTQCRTSRTCGAQDPKRYNLTTPSASSASTAAATGKTINGAGSASAAVSYGPAVGFMGLAGMVILGTALVL